MDRPAPWKAKWSGRVLAAQTDQGTEFAVGAGGERQGRTPLPQRLHLNALCEEIQHFLDESDLQSELAEERRLFQRLKALGETLNTRYALHDFPDEPVGPPFPRLKTLVRRILRPLFRLVLGPNVREQTQFNALQVQFLNAISALEVHVVSVQRLYKSHLLNLSENLQLLLEQMHQTDLRLNEKLDIFVEDLERQLVGLQTKPHSEFPVTEPRREFR